MQPEAIAMTTNTRPLPLATPKNANRNATWDLTDQTTGA